MGLVVAVASLSGAVSAALLGDSGTVDVQVANKNNSVVDEQTNLGAFISYFGDSDTTFGSSGTGTFDPFVRLQASPTEKGYNTDGTLEFDTKSGIWTHAILVSNIPQRPCPEENPPPPIGSLTCFELFVDINELNSDKQVSLNKVEVYFTSSATLTGYPFGGNATLQYSFDGDILINDVNQGSGRGDLRYDIPINDSDGAIPLPANCDYRNPACTTYFVLYSEWGDSSPAATWDSTGGFEEWKVRIYPVSAIQIQKKSTKTGNPLVGTAGTVFSITGPGGYSASVTDNGSGDSDSTVGQVCVSGLTPGTYTVNEVTPPPGYGGTTQTNVSAIAVEGTNCSTSKPTAANTAVFLNPPLGEITTGYHDLGSGETSATSITCAPQGGSNITPQAAADDDDIPGYLEAQAFTFNPVTPGTYVCTLVVDP